MYACVYVQKLLHTVVAAEDDEEVEILKARFETFELSRQLLQNEHPNAEEEIQRDDHLNKK